MSDEDLALALTEVAAKSNLILHGNLELPYDKNGRSQESIDQVANELVWLYQSVLRAIKEKK